MRLAALIIIASTAPLAGADPFLFPDNYEECILDNMPDAENDVIVHAITVKCAKEFGVLKITKKTAMSAEDCTIKYASEAKTKRAQLAIRNACNALYQKPRFVGVPAEEVMRGTEKPAARPSGLGWQICPSSAPGACIYDPLKGRYFMVETPASSQSGSTAEQPSPRGTTPGYTPATPSISCMKACPYQMKCRRDSRGCYHLDPAAGMAHP